MSMAPTPKAADIPGPPGRTPRPVDHGAPAPAPPPVAKTPRTNDALAAASAAIAAFDDARSTLSRFSSFGGGGGAQNLTPRPGTPGTAGGAAPLAPTSTRRMKSDSQLLGGRTSPVPPLPMPPPGSTQPPLSDTERRARIAQWTARLDELRSLHAEASDRLVFANQRIQVWGGERGGARRVAQTPLPPYYCSPWTAS